MNFRIITKNHETDLKIGSPQKIDFRADRTQESHPTGWELMVKFFYLRLVDNDRRHFFFSLHRSLHLLLLKVYF